MSTTHHWLDALTQWAVVQLSTQALRLCCQCRDEPPETPMEQTTVSPLLQEESGRGYFYQKKPQNTNLDLDFSQLFESLKL